MQFDPVLWPPLVREEVFDDRLQTSDEHLRAELLSHFSLHRDLGRLTHLHAASWKSPEELICHAMQEHEVSIANHGCRRT